MTYRVIYRSIGADGGEYLKESRVEADSVEINGAHNLVAVFRTHFNVVPKEIELSPVCWETKPLHMDILYMPMSIIEKIEVIA